MRHEIWHGMAPAQREERQTSAPWVGAGVLQAERRVEEVGHQVYCTTADALLDVPEGQQPACCEHTGCAARVSGCAAEGRHQGQHRSTHAGWPRQLGEAGNQVQFVMRTCIAHLFGGSGEKVWRAARRRAVLAAVAPGRAAATASTAAVGVASARALLVMTCSAAVVGKDRLACDPYLAGSARPCGDHRTEQGLLRAF